MGGHQEDVGGRIEVLHVISIAERPHARTLAGAHLLFEWAAAGEEQHEIGAAGTRRLDRGDGAQRVLPLLELAHEKRCRLAVAQPQRATRPGPLLGIGEFAGGNAVRHHDESVSKLRRHTFREYLSLSLVDADLSRCRLYCRAQPATDEPR